MTRSVNRVGQLGVVGKDLENSWVMISGNALASMRSFISAESLHEIRVGDLVGVYLMSTENPGRWAVWLGHYRGDRVWMAQFENGGGGSLADGENVEVVACVTDAAIVAMNAWQEEDWRDGPSYWSGSGWDSAGEYYDTGYSELTPEFIGGSQHTQNMRFSHFTAEIWVPEGGMADAQSGSFASIDLRTTQYSTGGAQFFRGRLMSYREGAWNTLVICPDWGTYDADVNLAVLSSPRDSNWQAIPGFLFRRFRFHNSVDVL